MTNNTKRITALFLVLLMIVSMITGCKKTDDETYDDYSYKLTEDGYYEGLDELSVKLPDFSSIKFVDEEILKWGMDYANSSGRADLKTIDDYIYMYGEEFLRGLELTQKDIAEEGDVVSINLEFYLNDKKLDEYDSTGSYKASSEGDAIVSSLVGRKAKELYEVQYTFPEDDLYYPSKTATVKVTVNSIDMADPINNGIVDANLDAIAEHLDGVTDTNTFLAALRPALAQAILTAFVEDYVQTIDIINVPKELTNAELYRLKARLKQINYTYDQYLEDMNTTNKDVKDACESIVRENIIYMLVFKDIDYTITDEDIAEYYGENIEYIAKMQGIPYMKLKMIKSVALEAIAAQVTIISADGEVIKESSRLEKIDPDQSTTEEATTPGETVASK